MLKNMAGFEWDFLGKTWGHYHVMFAASVVLRWMSAWWVRYLREPNSKSTRLILDEILDGPIARFLASPAGAYLSFRGEEEADEIALTETVEMPVVAAESVEEQTPPEAEPTKKVVPPPKMLEHRGRKEVAVKR
jgi:hypothetical protein